MHTLLSLVLLAGCTSISDEPRRVLLDEHYASAATGQLLTTYMDSLQLELAGKMVPIRFTWSAVPVFGSDSCRKITQLRVERTGGDASVRITSARSVSVGCAYGSLLRNDMNAKPRAEFREVFLSYETRGGIKEYTVQNSPVSLNGKGEFKK